MKPIKELKGNKLERRLKRDYIQMGTFNHYQIFAKSVDRVLYDPISREIKKEYEEGDEVFNYIRKHNKRQKEREH